MQGRGGHGGQCREEDAVDCGVVRRAAAMALGNKLVDAIGSNSLYSVPLGI